MSNQERSEYLGVYHNTSDKSKGEVPFRAAIRRGAGETALWVNLGYTKSERVAAKVYNMYAICFFGKGAIINDVTLTDEEKAEYKAFIAAKAHRIERHKLAVARGNTIIEQGGKFRTHLELRATQAAQKSPAAA